MRYAGGAAFLIVVLSGCASGTPGIGASPRVPASVSSSTASGSSTSADSEPAATTAQYASLVAKQRATLDKHLEEMLGADCDWSSPGQVDRPGLVVCTMGTLGMEWGAETLNLVLEGAQKPGVPAYVGAPPAEIQTLVTDTVTASTTLVKAAKAADDCVTTDGPDCMSKLLAFSFAMTGMQGQLAAWDPYS